MVIDFDTSALPRGVVGWHGLLDAIKAAHPSDENLWIEFKANVNPSTKDGRATIAKAIVAFSNRDAQSAEQWFGGHGVIVIGLEPGNLVGTPHIDPADLYSKINALLAPPAPSWHATPVDYEDKHVLVITVAPPCQGDAIAVIGKSSGEVEDGHVYVRKLGRSDRATSADVRRLSERLLSAGKSIDGITITPVEGSHVAAVEYPASWLEDWLYTEERRLLAPLDPAPPTRSMTPAERRMAGITESALADAVKTAAFAQKMMAAMNGTAHQENRSEAEFREEVGDYLDECRTRLVEAFGDLRQTAAYEVYLKITNTTGSNYQQVLVGLHVEGNVHGYEDKGAFTELADYLPRAPRKWGPWTEDRFGTFESGYSHLLGSSIGANLVSMTPRGPSPTITNDGSVEVTCVPVHLYPTRTTDLVTFWLVGDAPLGDSVRVTWTATASNVDGKLDGEFTIPVAPEVLDLSRELEHDPD